MILSLVQAVARRAGAATAPVGRAEGHPVGWAAARADRRRKALRHVAASGVTANWMARTRRGGWRGWNGPGRAGPGRAVKRHFGHSLSLESCLCTQNRVPEVSLRRRRVLLVAAHSTPYGAARGKREARDESSSGVRGAREECGNCIRDCA